MENKQSLDTRRNQTGEKNSTTNTTTDTTSFQKEIAKIGDFGTAKQIVEGVEAVTKIGT